MHRFEIALGAMSASQPLSNLNRRVLLSAEVSRLRNALIEDCHDYRLNGVFSISESISGIFERSYNWATVKAYYSTFYFLRSLLGYNGIGIAYCKSQKKYYSINYSRHLNVSALTKSTHASVVKAFSSAGLSANLLQLINGEDCVMWLKGRREEANYTASKFTDPNAPPHFTHASAQVLGNLINAYIQDTQFTYAYDPDHACLAYPITLLKELQTVIGANPALSSFRHPSSQSAHIGAVLNRAQLANSSAHHFLGKNL